MMRMGGRRAAARRSSPASCSSGLAGPQPVRATSLTFSLCVSCCRAGTPHSFCPIKKKITSPFAVWFETLLPVQSATLSYIRTPMLRLLPPQAALRTRMLAGATAARTVRTRMTKTRRMRGRTGGAPAQTEMATRPPQPLSQPPPRRASAASPTGVQQGPGAGTASLTRMRRWRNRPRVLLQGRLSSIKVAPRPQLQRRAAPPPGAAAARNSCCASRRSSEAARGTARPAAVGSRPVALLLVRRGPWRRWTASMRSTRAP